MKYHDSLAKSAEYLRLAVQYMTRQDAGLHPVSYAVWYEYAAGTNAALKAEVDALTQRGRRLSEETTHELYRKHVADLDQESSHQIAAKVRHIADQMTESAAEAGDHASRFGNKLERWRGTIGEPGVAAGVSGAFDDMLRDTRAMQGAIGVLQTQLEASTREAEQLKQEVSRIREEALVDALTGIANRRAFDRALAACVGTATPRASGPCLLMADIDHFKRINDTYGHLFGDRVLAVIGQTLKANVKGRDTAARYGGEEFAVLLPETPLSGAAGLAETLRATIAGGRVSRHDTGETVGNITISIGVAEYRDGESTVEFIGRADRALYTAKATGRNRVSVAPPEVVDHAA